MRAGTQYALRTTEFEHLMLMIVSAQAEYANSLVGDQAATEKAVASIFRALTYAVELLAEQEAA